MRHEKEYFTTYKSGELPTGETVSIELTPAKPGEYEFSCQMGMFPGKLIVK